MIDSSGTVHWEPGGVFKTMCVIDITYYPFDDQTCRLTFGAWSYHTAKMNLESAKPSRDPVAKVTLEAIHDGVISPSEAVAATQAGRS